MLMTSIFVPYVLNPKGSNSLPLLRSLLDKLSTNQQNIHRSSLLVMKYYSSDTAKVLPHVCFSGKNKNTFILGERCLSGYNKYCQLRILCCLNLLSKYKYVELDGSWQSSSHVIVESYWRCILL